jgi:hypothetical protein
MSAMAAAAPRPRLDSVLSFGDAMPGAGADRPAADDELATLASSDAGSEYDYDDDDAAGFEFAFAPPLAAPGSSAGDVLDLASADDLFAHGRILPAYPVFDRHLLESDGEAAPAPAAPQASSTAPTSPDTYCAWAPRSAPGSPTRDPAPPFPKSSSTGEARRFWRLRGLVSGGGGRSHSDGKEKFVFLQPTTPSKTAGNKTTVDGDSRRPAAKPSAPLQKQSKKKSSKAAGAAATEMDMATAHKLFYGKPGGGALAGDRRQQQQQSYLPYRPGIVGFFTAAHALGRSHHPY